MRCFIAIEIPDEVKATLIMLQEELKKCGADVRWIAPDNIHLTLKFLGSVEEKEISRITEIMEHICKRYSPFNLEFKGMGIFPNTKFPRVLWIGVEDNTTLKRLQEDIEKGIAEIGFGQEDREFTAHLTLGRFRASKGKANLLEIVKLHKDNSFCRIEVKSVSLMRSELRPDGARYTKLAEVSLTL